MRRSNICCKHTLTLAYVYKNAFSDDVFVIYSVKIWHSVQISNLEALKGCDVS